MRPKYRNIILCDNSHHYLTRTTVCDSRQCCTHCYSNVLWVPVHMLLVQCNAVSIRLFGTTFKEDAVNIYLRLTDMWKRVINTLFIAHKIMQANRKWQATLLTQNTVPTPTQRMHISPIYPCSDWKDGTDISMGTAHTALIAKHVSAPATWVLSMYACMTDAGQNGSGPDVHSVTCPFHVSHVSANALHSTKFWPSSRSNVSIEGCSLPTTIIIIIQFPKTVTAQKNHTHTKLICP